MTLCGMTNGRMLTSAVALVLAAGLLGGQARAQNVALVETGTIGGATGTSQVLGITYDGWTLRGTATNESKAYAVSGDGSTVVGSSVTQGGVGHAFKWTASGGLLDIGALGGADHISFASAANRDGSVIVGYSTYDSSGVWHGFVWSQAAGMIDTGTLVTLPGRASYSASTAVSDDGTVVAGGSWTNTTIDHATRWTQAGGLVDLGTISGTGWSDATSISGDGNILAGVSTASGGTQHAFRWTQAGGMADLGTLSGGSGTSWAFGLSKDGAVVVGRSSTSGGQTHAFRWTSAGMSDLGTIGNISGDSLAYAANADGSVIVGTSQFATGSPFHATVWTAAAGTQDLNALLLAGGINMNGIELTDARGVSANGQIVAGSGIFAAAGGGTRAYLARIGGASGLTTPDAIVASINALARTHTAQMVTQILSSTVYLGANEQVSCNANCGGAYASWGSFNASLHGRHALNEEWTLLVGMGAGNYREQGADVTRSATLAGALRFDPAHMGASRPYFEIGATTSPSQTVIYSRPYDNGSDTATGTGRTTSNFTAAYVRAGWVSRISPRDELAGFVGVAAIRQKQNSYAEVASADNPFDASFAGGSDRMNVVTLGAQYSHLFGRRIEMTADVALNQSFRSRSGVTATVVGMEPEMAHAQELAWAQPGLRLAYRATKSMTVTGFVNATFRPKAFGGTGVHGGIGISLKF